MIHCKGFYQQIELPAMVGEKFMGIIRYHYAKIKSPEQS